MKIGIVIPWREQPSRIPPFKALVKWYEENLPEAKIYYPDRQSPVWLMSATRNDGVRMAEADGCDVIVMNDADTIPQIGPLMDAINAAYLDNKIHLPYTDYRMLGSNGTRQFLVNKIDLERCFHRSYRDACSGTNVFTPETWWSLGGNDEKFKQWGYEDTAILYVHQVVTGSDFIRHKGVAFSLGHDLQPRGVTLQKNKSLYEHYLTIKDPAELVEFVKSDSFVLDKRLSANAPEKEGPLNIVAVVSLYLPKNNAGAEVMLHEMLLDLKTRGHNVSVICEKQSVQEVDGIPLIDNKDARASDTVVRSADLLITHLGGTRLATSYASSRRKPLVHLVHNDKQLKDNRVSSVNAKMLIFNSAWVFEENAPTIPSIIVNPPSDPERYRVKPGNKITLINLSENKGGAIFWQLARLFPEKEFLGIKGGYDDQILHKTGLPNVTILENTRDMKSVYEQTGILIMPSAYESWGKVAMEAACSGIPVVVNGTSGLSESIGEAGIIVDENDAAGFFHALKKLEDKKTYQEYSELAKGRASAAYNTYKNQMNILEGQLRKVALMR
jgi:glycosyltransferase involved in cell wall biosynthesis